MFILFPEMACRLFLYNINKPQRELLSRFFYLMSALAVSIGTSVDVNPDLVVFPS